MTTNTAEDSLFRLTGFLNDRQRHVVRNWADPNAWHLNPSITGQRPVCEAIQRLCLALRDAHEG